MKCNLQCPPNMRFFCCSQCYNKPQSLALKDVFPDKWNEGSGFWRREDGCQLGEDRPDECKDYDCRNYIMSVGYVWHKGRWQFKFLHPIDCAKYDREFCDRINELCEEYA